MLRYAPQSVVKIITKEGLPFAYGLNWKGVIDEERVKRYKKELKGHSKAQSPRLRKAYKGLESLSKAK